jgi:twitching motility protein PilU
LRLDLSLNLQAVVSLRLLHGLDGHRVPAVEILLKSPYVSDLIAKGEVDLLKEAMKMAVDRGMQTFDESLFHLYVNGRISLETALDNADSRNDLQLRINLSGATVGDGDGAQASEMTIEPVEAPKPEHEADTGQWIADSLGGQQPPEASKRNRPA